jgi:predicted transposase YbfD/YdcC
MALEQYSTLLAALQDVPDPRKARGKRYPWTLLLTIIVAGLASNYQTARAIAQWARLHAADLRAALPDLVRIPSESTLLRTLRQIDATMLEQHLGCFIASLPTPTDYAGCIISPHGEILQGQAIDGKTVRTATAHGDRTHLVSLVQHTSGQTLAQTEVATKRTEVAASQQLLAARNLSGTVTTMDAGVTQRAVAQQIRQRGGHYLMVVKKNHPQMYAELALFFELPGILADAESYDRWCSVDKGHGRLEKRTLECLSGTCVDWRWPDAAQVLRRTCERLERKKGKRSLSVTYAITSLSAHEASARDLALLWRRHWTIENRKHYVRDVTLGEDRHPMHTGRAPQVLAALRNSLIDLWRAQGWTNIADAVRDTAASVQRALTFIGALPAITLT